MQQNKQRSPSGGLRIVKEQHPIVSDFSLVLSKEDVTQGFPNRANSSQHSLRNNATAPSSQSQGHLREHQLATSVPIVKHMNGSLPFIKSSMAHFLNQPATVHKDFKQIGLVFLNNRVKTRIYNHETMDSFTKRLSLTLEIETEHHLGFLPLGHHDKVLGRAEPIQKPVQCGLSTSQTHLRKDANKGGKTQGAPLDMEKLLQEKIAAKNENGSKKAAPCEAEEIDEPHMIPETAIIRTLKELKGDKFYLLVYIKPKTDEENENDAENQSKLIQKCEKSGKPINSSSAASSSFNYSIERARRPKGEHRTLTCPFFECLKEFAETGNLKTHLRTHTGERPFVCSYGACKKQFITKGHLKTHELIHSGDKPYECEICGKCYSRSGRLKIHVRTHTGEKPFRCPLASCGKTFTEKGNLKTHLRIHSGEKPFACTLPGCQKTFTTQGHLTDHLRRHSGDRPFKCTLCVQAFMRSSTLKIHMKRHFEDGESDGKPTDIIEEVNENSDDSELEMSDVSESNSFDPSDSSSIEESEGQKRIFSKMMKEGAATCEARKRTESAHKEPKRMKTSMQKRNWMDKGPLAKAVGLKRNGDSSFIEFDISQGQADQDNQTNCGLSRQKRRRVELRGAEVSRCPPDLLKGQEERKCQNSKILGKFSQSNAFDGQSILTVSTTNPQIYTTKAVMKCNDATTKMKNATIEGKASLSESSKQTTKKGKDSHTLNGMNENCEGNLKPGNIMDQIALKSANADIRSSERASSDRKRKTQNGKVAVPSSIDLKTQETRLFSDQNKQNALTYSQLKESQSKLTVSNSKRVEKNRAKELSNQKKRISTQTNQATTTLKQDDEHILPNESMEEVNLGQLLPPTAGDMEEYCESSLYDNAIEEQQDQLPLPILQQEDGDDSMIRAGEQSVSCSNSRSSSQFPQSREEDHDNISLCSDDQHMIVDDIIRSSKRDTNFKKGIFELTKQCSSPFAIVRKSYGDGLYSMTNFAHCPDELPPQHSDNGPSAMGTTCAPNTSNFSFAINQTLLGQSPSYNNNTMINGPHVNGSTALTPLNSYLGTQVSSYHQGVVGLHFAQPNGHMNQSLKTKTLLSTNQGRTTGSGSCLQNESTQRQLSFKNIDSAQHASLFAAENAEEEGYYKRNSLLESHNLVKFEQSQHQQGLQLMQQQKRNPSKNELAALQSNQGVTSCRKQLRSREQDHNYLPKNKQVDFYSEKEENGAKQDRGILGFQKLTNGGISLSTKTKQCVENARQSRIKDQVTPSQYIERSRTRSLKRTQQTYSILQGQIQSPAAATIGADEDANERNLDCVFLGKDDGFNADNINLQSPDLLFALMSKKKGTSALKKLKSSHKKERVAANGEGNSQVKGGPHQNLIERWKSLQSPSSTSNLNDIIQISNNFSCGAGSNRFGGFLNNLYQIGTPAAAERLQSLLKTHSQLNQSEERPLFKSNITSSNCEPKQQGHLIFEKSPSKFKLGPNNAQDFETTNMFLRSNKLPTTLEGVRYQANQQSTVTPSNLVRQSTTTSTSNAQTSSKGGAAVPITPMVKTRSNASPHPDALMKSGSYTQDIFGVDSSNTYRGMNNGGTRALQAKCTSPIKSKFAPTQNRGEGEERSPLFKLFKGGQEKKATVNGEHGPENQKGFKTLLLVTPKKDADEECAVNTLNADNFSSIVSKLRSMSRSTPRRRHLKDSAGFQIGGGSRIIFDRD